jgi:hypothetical protein
MTEPTKMNAQKRRQIRLVVLLAILGLGLILRLVRLDRIPPGLCPDEAIQALQGMALWRGESLPAAPLRPFPCWPLWCRLEGAATAAIGCTVQAIRFPAVLAGLLSVILVGPVAGLLGGPWAGLAAAAFLSFSFWHVVYSRMALPCILVVAETMAIALILLRPGRLGWKEGTAAAVVSAAAALGYAASLVTPILAVFLIALRLAVRPAGVREYGLATGFAVAAIPLALAVAAAHPGNTGMIAVIGLHTPSELAEQAWLCARNIALPVAAPWSHFSNYPPGYPRFGFMEVILLVVGLVTLVRGGSLLPWHRIAVLGWIFISFAPELFGGGGINLIRGLPELASAAILAGLGASALARMGGRGGTVFAAALLLATGAHTAGRVFGPSAVYQRAMAWPSVVDAQAAGRLSELAADSGLYLNPMPGYLDSPILAFHLRASGPESRISGTKDQLWRPKVAEVFRDPATHEPVLLLLVSGRRLNGRTHAGLRSVDELLGPGRQALRAGRYAEVEKLARDVLRLVPDSGVARDLLGDALAGEKGFSVPRPIKNR